MIKADTQFQGNIQPTCKKIQNYVFKFADLLGKGNFSKVYKAYNEVTSTYKGNLGEIVAIKIIQLNSLKSKKLEQLLASEVEVLKKLDHPNVLRCYEVFNSNRNCYIITQLCNGGDLETKLRKQHHFSESAAIPLIRDVFNGLLYLAERNIIHRDLKVANIFLHNGRAKIADFGFAKFTRDSFKDINIGSPIYMSPQGLINNHYGPKSDIWAFGILIYELLHGETPYAFCQTESELKYHISIPLTWNKMKPQLSNQIKEVIIQCMQVNENKRITAYQLKKMPFMRRILRQSPQPNMMGSNKQIYQSPQSQNHQNSIQGHSRQFQPPPPLPLERRRALLSMQGTDPRNSPMNMQETRNLSSKHTNKIESHFNNRPYDVARKGVSTQKFALKSEQLISHNYTGRNNDFGSNVISTMITFKQCVNVLHYCRLIYKYLTTLRSSVYNDESQVRKFSTWLIHILAEINKKIQTKNIIYEGQNVGLREKKLREVSQEYTRKYNNELSQYITPQMSLNIPYMKQYCESIYQLLDSTITKQKSKQVLILGHSIVMIYDCTKLLDRCYKEQNYKAMAQYKEIEIFLNTNKDSMDLHSYMLIRKKLTFDNS